MRRHWIIATLAAATLLLGWYSWRTTRQAQQFHRDLETAVARQLTAANDMIFDANWRLQQVQDPGAPESEPLIRQAAQNLIVAREQLAPLRWEVYASVIPEPEVRVIHQLVHMAGINLKQMLVDQSFQRFAWPPLPGSVRLLRILGSDDQEPVPLTDAFTFSLPQESGLHFYHAEAAWEQGSGTYVFKVQVRP